MLLADDSIRRLLRSASANADLTIRWQSSNVPRTASERTLPPQQVSPDASWVGETESLGKQYRHFDIRPAKKCRRDRRPRVPGSDQNGERATRRAVQTGEAGRQKLCAKVLEGSSRSVEELQDLKPAVLIERLQRRGPRKARAVSCGSAAVRGSAPTRAGAGGRRWQAAPPAH